jgi:ArsR family transcriptional regulator
VDSAALLDVLGNANRRRILRLLARRPHYVSELSDRLSLSPKAVIDHLRTLEEAGLIRSRSGEGRRKYFRIADALQLEVRVSPYDFRARSTSPGAAESSSGDGQATADRDPPATRPDESGPEPRNGPAIGRELRRLLERERELSREQRRVQGRLTGLLDAVGERFGDGDDRLHAALLVALGRDGATARALARAIDAPPERVGRALEELAAAGLVTQDGGTWRLPD